MNDRDQLLYAACGAINAQQHSSDVHIIAGSLSSDAHLESASSPDAGAAACGFIRKLEVHVGRLQMRHVSMTCRDSRLSLRCCCFACSQDTLRYDELSYCIPS